MKSAEILILIIFILIIILLILYFTKKYTVESFGDFSPYLGNPANYKFKINENIDRKLLDQTIWKWERPFNCNSSGYINAEPRGIPPMNPIYSYPTFNFRPENGPCRDAI
jgi:hypothetical protein